MRAAQRLLNQRAGPDTGGVCLAGSQPMEQRLGAACRERHGGEAGVRHVLEVPLDKSVLDGCALARTIFLVEPI